MTRVLTTVAAILAVILVVASAPAGAEDGRVPMPQLTHGKGDKCLAPNAEMRRHHMERLKHQRDETMHQGIRGKEYSLKACVECHSAPDPKDPKGTPTLEGFCMQCHEYAAVDIDCFSCHTTKPMGNKQP